MKHARKPLLQIMVLTLLFSMFTPLPAVAASKVFEVTKSGNQNILNDTSDPSINVNFSGYSLNDEDYSHRMVVFDKFNGVTRKIEHCWVEDCSFYLNSVTGLVEAGHHEYFAVIDQADNPYGDFTIEDDQVQTLEDLDNPIHTSTSLKVFMERPTISLSSNTNYFTNQLFAENNEDYPELELQMAKPAIAEDYAYYTFDTTNNHLVSIDTNFTSPISISTPTNMNNDHVTFQTFQAKWGIEKEIEDIRIEELEDIREVSNTITLTRRPWIIGEITDFIGGVSVEFTEGGGDKTFYFSKASTGEIVYEDGYPSTSWSFVPYQPIVVTVADPWTGSMPTNITQLTGVKANSEGIRDTIEKPGLESKEQVAGGSNPSENCTQNCGGDPINFYSGEFFENATDLTMAGAGIAPNVGRSFSTQRKSELSAMGYGWRSNYDMKIQSANAEPLSTSTEIKVIQENGSASFFTRNTDGTYSAGDKVKAKLSKDSNGKYVLVRDLRTTFTFSATGKLEKVEDLNGNALNMTYTGNNLSSVADGNGNTLTYAYNADNLISKVTANNGRSVTYSYNAKRLMRTVNENGVAFDYTYDTSRRVKTLKDALGGVTENFYDAENRVTRQDDPYDKRLRFAYAQDEGLNQETTITYPNGRIVIETYQDGALTRKIENPETNLEKKWYYSYDANNNLLSSVAPDGSHSNSTYDSRGNLLTHRNELGGVSTFTYDALNNVLTATNPLGKTSVNTYDTRGNLLSTTDPLGNKTTYSWSPTGNLESVVNPLGNKTSANPDDYKTVLKYTSKGLVEETIDSMGNSTSGKYDALGRSIATTLPKGNETPTVDDYTIKTEYNPLDLPSKVTDQKGHASEITYDNAGNALTTKDASGNITTMTYDLMGRLLTMTGVDGVTSYTYNAVGQVLTITDAKNNVTLYAYNKSGDVTKLTDPKLNVTSMTYNKVGQVLTSKDPTNAIMKFYYDNAGNQIAVEDAQGKMSGAVYNNANQVTRSYDKEGRSTTYTYDDNGRLIKTTLPDESTTLSEYDANGNQTKRTNGENDDETWAYDSLNRVNSYTDQEGKSETYAYDSHSNVATTTLENGSIIGTEYDEKDLPTLIDYAGTSKDTEFTYNSLDLVTKEKVGLKETNTTYDHAGRVLTRNGVTYEYDALGNQEKITYPSGRIVDYIYDTNQNLVSAASADIGNITYTYDKRNILTSTTLPNGVTETRTQDALARTTNISIANTTQELHAVNKAYSPNSNLATSKYGVGSSVQSESYEHDELNRTTGVTSTINNTTSANTYNKANHLTTFEGKSVISDKVGKPLTIGAIEFTYDDLGQRISQKENLATTPEKEYSWNVDGTLSEATNTLSTVNYDYSASGLLSERSLNGVSKNFAWDETASNALMLSDGDFEYIYGATRVPVAQIELATGVVEYLHSDVNGSVIAVTTESGVLAGVTNYGAYGKRLGSAISRFGYAGEWTDPETTHTYLRARWYDSSTGSFLSKDPLYQATSEAYGYAGGNPLVRIDPSGMAWGIRSPRQAFNELIVNPIANKIHQVQREISNKVHQVQSEISNFVEETDWEKVTSNVATVAGYVGTAAAVGAFVIGTGGVGLVAVVGIASTSTVIGTAATLANTAIVCEDEGFSSGCKWGAVNTVTSAIPLGGLTQRGAALTKEAFSRKVIRGMTADSKVNNIRRNLKYTGKRTDLMQNFEFNSILKRNGKVSSAYLGANSIGLGSSIFSKFSISQNKETNSCL